MLLVAREVWEVDKLLVFDCKCCFARTGAKFEVEVIIKDGVNQP